MTGWHAALAAAASTVGEDFRAAMAEASAARTRVYHDAEADLAQAEDYYRGVGVEGLADLVRSTHTAQPRYKPSLEVYPWVDLQPDGTLRSLYTAESFQPEALIQADVEVLQTRMARLMQATMRGETDPATLEAQIAAELRFNCEHVVPQSWYAEDEPMRGDLHHLFACEPRCNSFRGNTAFAEFADFPEEPSPDGIDAVEVVRDDCGKSASGGFEPLHGKGAAALAVFYSGCAIRRQSPTSRCRATAGRWCSPGTNRIQSRSGTVTETPPYSIGRATGTPSSATPSGWVRWQKASPSRCDDQPGCPTC